MIHSMEAVQAHLDSLPDGDYLLQVLNRFKSNERTHALYSKVVAKSEIMETMEEINCLGDLWRSRDKVEPVVYMSNVRIDQAKGYVALIRDAAGKMLEGKAIKARLLSTSKPAYLGMERDYFTIDIDGKTGIDDFVLGRAMALRACGWSPRLVETHNGYHITVIAAGRRELIKSLGPIMEHVDKQGKDVMSPVPGTIQKGFNVTRLL